MNEESGARRLRILELGNQWRFKETWPEETDLVISYARVRPGDLAWRGFTPGVALELLGKLRRREFDLVVCYPPLYAPWHPRSFLKVLQKRHVLFPVGLFMSFGPWLLRFAKGVPLAVVDLEDSFGINRHCFFLLDRCTLYFKRELPVDRWQLLYKSAHRNLPTLRVRRSRRMQQRLAKVRPISFGAAESERIMAAAAGQREKTADVFFAGQIEASSTVRSRGIAQLRALESLGYRIDIPAQRLPPDEFFARCARAWLTWSPEGFGWDCGRHYEAPLCGSVPVINSPTIERHQPLREGVHCFYYDVEGDDLQRTMLAALDDKPRLAAMAAAARQHVLEHHTYERLCDYVIRSCLDGAER